MQRLADFVHARPRRVLALAFVVTAVAGALGGSVAERLHPFAADDPGTESIRADRLLEERTGLQPDVGFVALVDDREQLPGVVRELRAHPDVGAVQTATDSRDGRAAYAAAQFRAGADSEETAEELADALADREGVTVGGIALAQAEVGETVERDLRRAELLAFPLLFLLSLLFFRSLVAALLPLLVGGLAIVSTLLVLRVANEAWDISIFALNLTTGLGLGLAIDYSLFIVSRYREELARRGPGLEALRATMATAGRTVLFSSATVAAALAALLTFPQRFLYSMGVGGVSVTVLAATIALVVLPALLALLGERVNALAPRRLQRAAHRDARPEQAGFWYRLSRLVMRRPARIAVLAAAFLIALGIPFASATWVPVDVSVLPAGAEPRVVDERLQREFPPHRTEPLVVVATGASADELAAYREEVAALPGVAAVSPPERIGGDGALLHAMPAVNPDSAAAEDLVREVRALDTPFGVLVGGRTAEFVDQKASLAAHLPLAVLLVVGTTFVVLFLMTGSVVLPLKAAVMNVLTLSATLGALVLVFQDGRLERLLGYTSQGGLDATQPLFLAIVAFGLSTDYAVFLLSRIKEARDGGLPDDEAVAVGLERTGRIVTAAALLFAVAIGAFVTSQIVFIKELGLGTALAVLVDATIIRALLVPSLMKLLGWRNWWAPAPLRRFHARFGMSEAA